MALQSLQCKIRNLNHGDDSARFLDLHRRRGCWHPDLTGVFATEEGYKPRTVEQDGEEGDELEDEIEGEAGGNEGLIIRAM
ncbi:hypothetical protein [Pseudodesulfovibrio piezophilus]|uniref:Uncharacterized protein n=1 Tax=Pseudodesulfovibrio piezophilus (strain DSM 21447 / JCM 15486 / C1TLV30) TaxID=1322246 RepID=M1WL78_PSEP2|nr:hypothetical protein [Pseudodesulfovibrio piezophilus]CCH47390.1 protein of unknown function [Pseudodesulfovibrio piezophilus C1TLV30]